MSTPSREAAPGTADDAGAKPGGDVSALRQLEARVRAGEFGNVHSVLVMAQSDTLAEFYLEGEDERRGAAPARVQFGPEVLHDVRSITKSVVGLLFAIAQAEGKLGDLERPVLSYFPEHRDLATPERARIEVRHLLSMTPGLQWEEEGVPYGDPQNSMAAMGRAADPIRHMLSLPIVSPPGQRFKYSGGDVTVLAEILRRAVQVPIDEYARRMLFEPLGITHYEWPKDARGVPTADSGLRLRPRDMAKLGNLVLERGQWQGKQIVPEAWIAAATTAHAQVSGAGACGIQFGYLFWAGNRCEGEARTPWIAALGNGGQRFVVFPSRKQVIVTTAGLYRDPKQRELAFALTNALYAATIQPSGPTAL